MKQFIVQNLFFIFMISCSDHNLSSISQTAQSHPGGSDGTKENQQKIESTDIGNGQQPGEGSIGPGKFNLTCESGAQNRYSCMLAESNGFMAPTNVKDVQWSVRNCEIEGLGYASGTNLKVVFTTADCSEWTVDVQLTFEDGQTNTLTFNQAEVMAPAAVSAESGGDDGETSENDDEEELVAAKDGEGHL